MSGARSRSLAGSRWNKGLVSAMSGFTSMSTQINAQAVTCTDICAARRPGANAMAPMTGEAVSPTRYQLMSARPSSTASAASVTGRVERITGAAHDVITEAIDAGGSTLQDFRGVGGDDAMGYFSHNFLVYGREDEPCLAEGCTGTIRRIVQSNRSTFFCPVCQR